MSGNKKAEEILKNIPDFIALFGLPENLTEVRANDALKQYEKVFNDRYSYRSELTDNPCDPKSIMYDPNATCLIDGNHAKKKSNQPPKPEIANYSANTLQSPQMPSVILPRNNAPINYNHGNNINWKF